MDIKIKFTGKEIKCLTNAMKAFGLNDEAERLETGDYAENGDNTAKAVAYKCIDGGWRVSFTVREGFACGVYDIFAKHASTVKSVFLMAKGAFALAKDTINGIHNDLTALSKSYDDEPEEEMRRSA